MKALLYRRKMNSERTEGTLVLNTGWSCFTLERPWINNASNISCIPKDTYHVLTHTSPSRGECFAVFDVPKRKDILIHAFNDVEESRGCIGVGLESHGGRILSSRLALAELLNLAPDGFELTIVEL